MTPIDIVALAMCTIGITAAGTAVFYSLRAKHPEELDLALLTAFVGMLIFASGLVVSLAASAS